MIKNNQKKGKVKFKKSLIFSFLCISLSLLLSCGTKENETRQILDQNKKQKPVWVSQVPAQDEKNIYFLGFAVDDKNLDHAQKQARQMAFEKINNYMQIEAMSQFNYERTESGKKITDQFQLYSDKVRLKQIKQVDMYYELINHPDGPKVDCFVLLSVPLAELERLKREKEEKLESLWQDYHQVVIDEKKGKGIKALKELKYIHKRLNSLEPDLSIHKEQMILSVKSLKEKIKVKQKELEWYFNQLGLLIIKSQLSESFEREIQEKTHQKMEEYDVILSNKKREKGLNLLLKIKVRPSTRFGEKMQAYVLDLEGKFIALEEKNMIILEEFVDSSIRQVAQNQKEAEPKLAEDLAGFLTKKVVKKLAQLQRK